MYTFAIYAAQFRKNPFGIKPENTTCIGEINLASVEYQGLTPEEAVNKRLYQEHLIQKNNPGESLSDYIINVSFWIIEYKNEKDADVQVHRRLERMGYLAHRNKKTNRKLEYFDLGFHFKEIVQRAVEEAFDINFLLRFIIRFNQFKCMQKITYAILNGYTSFLVGAICRFGKSATLLYYFTTIKPFSKILIVTSKCDTRNSWYDDYIKFVDKTKYKFYTKEDIMKNPSILNEENIIVWVSLQSSAKNFDIDNDSACDIKNEAWQQILVNERWDGLFADEVHYGVDTPRSTKLIDAIHLNKNSKCFKVDISATPFKKLQRGEYSREHAFIYDVVDERKDYFSGNFEKTASDDDVDKMIKLLN